MPNQISSIAVTAINSEVLIAIKTLKKYTTAEHYQEASRYIQSTSQINRRYAHMLSDQGLLEFDMDKRNELYNEIQRIKQIRPY